MYGSYSPPHFPERLITITFTPGDNTELQLRHPVTLKGIKSDVEKLNIILTICKINDCFTCNFTNSKQVIVILPQIQLKHTRLYMVNWSQLYILECILV